ncbi:MAG: hypothetical protein ACOY94_14450 [Bacillota bacterium]
MTTPNGNGANNGWKDVVSGYQRGDANKVGAYVTVTKHGAVEAPVEPTAMLLQCIRERGLAKTRCLLQFKANTDLGQVAAIPIPTKAGTPASGQINWSRGKGSPRASFHIGGVFKDYPELAPIGEVRCQVDIDTAPDGLPMLIIAVKAGVGTQTTSNSGSHPNPTPGAQAAAGGEEGAE